MRAFEIVRSQEGIEAEKRDLLKAIEKERNFLKTGERLGTWHYPQKRINQYLESLKRPIFHQAGAKEFIKVY